LVKIERALISVSNKDGIVDLARDLSDMGVELISTGGTASLLEKSGLRTVNISDVTGFPEMLDGRVKTLHPEHPRRIARPEGHPVSIWTSFRRWASGRSTWWL